MTWGEPELLPSPCMKCQSWAGEMHLDPFLSFDLNDETRRFLRVVVTNKWEERGRSPKCTNKPCPVPQGCPHLSPPPQWRRSLAAAQLPSRALHGHGRPPPAGRVGPLAIASRATGPGETCCRSSPAQAPLSKQPPAPPVATGLRRASASPR